MKKRRWGLCSGAALLFILISAAIWWLAAPRARITRAVFNELQIGMPLRDVERLVNVPPGDYSTGLRGFNQFMTKESNGSTETEMLCATPKLVSFAEMQANDPHRRYVAWWGCNRALIVVLDDQDIVKHVTYAKRTAPSNEWLGHFRFWIESRFGEQD